MGVREFPQLPMGCCNIPHQPPEVFPVRSKKLRNFNVAFVCHQGLNLTSPWCRLFLLETVLLRTETHTAPNLMINLGLQDNKVPFRR